MKNIFNFRANHAHSLWRNRFHRARAAPALRARGTPYFGVGTTTCVWSDGDTSSHQEVSSLGERASILQRIADARAVVLLQGTAITSTRPRSCGPRIWRLDAAFQVIPAGLVGRHALVYTSSCTVAQRLRPRPLVRPIPLRLIRPTRRSSCSVRSFSESRWPALASGSWRACSMSVAVGSARIVRNRAAGDRDWSGRRSTFHLRTNEPILDVIDVNEAAHGLLALAETPRLPMIVNVSPAGR